MASDAESESHWERVAAELRACREAQQRAWGDIDNTTLGRYLSDEVTSEERRQIEGALDELPELRKLTELVRDVLGEPAAVPYGPAILPFPQSQTRLPSIARPTILREGLPAVAPPGNWKQRGAAGPYRQRGTGRGGGFVAGSGPCPASIGEHDLATIRTLRRHVSAGGVPWRVVRYGRPPTEDEG